MARRRGPGGHPLHEFDVLRRVLVNEGLVGLQGIPNLIVAQPLEGRGPGRPGVGGNGGSGLLPILEPHLVVRAPQHNHRENSRGKETLLGSFQPAGQGQGRDSCHAHPEAGQGGVLQEFSSAIRHGIPPPIEHTAAAARLRNPRQRLRYPSSSPHFWNQARMCWTFPMRFEGLDAMP